MPGVSILQRTDAERVRPAAEARSPEAVKISLASAISLGLARGRMYRGAVNRCVNLLVHYPEGCSANCAYCGLADKRPGRYRDKSFIHVAWPVFHMDEIVEAIQAAPGYVKRTCISMITNGRCRKDTIYMAERLTRETDPPLSVLISPTLLEKDDLKALRDAGADKIGVALDLATPELFDRYRGTGVSGPHRWDKYWRILEQGLEIFGPTNVGAHLMVGMGETEEQMVTLMERLWGMGAANHLFSFLAEEDSALADRPQPPWPVYLRVQLARYLIEEGIAGTGDMTFDPRGRIRDFGLPREELTEIIGLSTPFMTTGCLGPDGEVACNRPFGNCLPDVRQWNYPYLPNHEETELIKRHIMDLQKIPLTESF